MFSAKSYFGIFVTGSYQGHTCLIIGAWYLVKMYIVCVNSSGVKILA